MANIKCFIGTVYGGAEALAEQLKPIAEKQNHDLSLFNPGTVADFIESDVILVITSTTGQGDIPYELESLYLALESELPTMQNKPFAVIAMGDSSYGDTFCGAGKKFRELLLSLQGSEAVTMLKIDATENYDPAPVALPWFNTFLTALN